MTATFRCPHCGQRNPIDASFCRSCGTDLREVDVQASYPPESADPAGPEEGDGAAEDDTCEESLPAENGASAPAEESLASAQGAGEGEADPAGGPASQPSEPLLPGLLPPIEPWIGTPDPPQPGPGVSTLDDETRRQMRRIFATEVPLSDAPAPRQDTVDGGGLRRRPWIDWLLLAVLVLALMLGQADPVLLPHVWPGVSEAYRTIEALPSGSIVLVDWAYDPATAGEMDLVVRPVIEHLLAQEATLLVVSQLPMGPATARRLIAAVAQPPRPEALSGALDASLVEAGFLPGGATTLPLLGQAPLLGIPFDLQGRALADRPMLASLSTTPPAFHLIVAARAESVQRWLEQVQPLSGVPAVAVTSAAAGPVLRPYFDSGQLAGLVSGISGGIGYRILLPQRLSGEQQTVIWRQMQGRNGALLVLLFVVVVSNLTVIAKR